MKDKNLTWEKPVLIQFEKTISKGSVGVLYEDVCTRGNSARYLCSNGSSNK